MTTKPRKDVNYTLSDMMSGDPAEPTPAERYEAGDEEVLLDADRRDIEQTIQDHLNRVNRQAANMGIKQRRGTDMEEPGLDPVELEAEYRQKHEQMFAVQRSGRRRAHNL